MDMGMDGKKAEMDTEARGGSNEEAYVAKHALRRVAREERLLGQAEGKLWLQYLPVFTVVVLVLLGLAPPLRPVLVALWFAVPMALVQIGLLTTGRRIDAILALLKDQRFRSEDGPPREDDGAG